MKSSLVSDSWKSSLQGVVSEDSSSEDNLDEDCGGRTTRRKRPYRSHNAPPPATRRRTSSASESSVGEETVSSPSASPSIARGGVACPFPWKLHDMLDLCSAEDDPLVTWNPEGTAFGVLNAKAFVQTILPRFFAQTKYASFQRQLNLYGFTRISLPLPQHGHKSFSFYTHPHFVRGQRDRVRYMIRCKIKGTGKKRFDDEGDEAPGKGWCDATYESSSTAPMESSSWKDPFLLLPEDSKEDHDSVEEWNTDATMFLPPTTEGEEEWLPPPLTCDVCPDGTVEDGTLAFFEGHPFHFLEPPTTKPLWSGPPKPLPFSMQPMDGDDVFLPSVGSTQQESWCSADRLPRPQILNREQQRMILDHSTAVCPDRSWCNQNGGNWYRVAQV